MQQEDIVIPRIIHTNWAGGKTPMRDAGINNIAKWAKTNPGFKVYLWVDYSTADTNMVEYYRQAFATHGLTIYKDDPGYQEDQTPIVLMDIRRFNIANHCDLYEIGLLKSNYGKSSDYERYAELERFGGVYIDCSDVCPSRPLIETGIFNRKLSTHIL